MQRKRPFSRPERRSIPARLRAEIMMRQEGRCADCGTRLIIGVFVFDHRPPIALRGASDDVNDPDRLAAICWTCNEKRVITADASDTVTLLQVKLATLSADDFAFI